MELGVHVLTPTFWPLQAMGGHEEQQNTCTFPREVEELREAFTKFYLNRHSGRKLQWQANMVGHCTYACRHFRLTLNRERRMSRQFTKAKSWKSMYQHMAWLFYLLSMMFLLGVL